MATYHSKLNSDISVWMSLSLQDEPTVLVCALLQRKKIKRIFYHLCNWHYSYYLGHSSVTNKHQVRWKELPPLLQLFVFILWHFPPFPLPVYVMTRHLGSWRMEDLSICRWFSLTRAVHLIDTMLLKRCLYLSQLLIKASSYLRLWFHMYHLMSVISWEYDLCFKVSQHAVCTCACIFFHFYLLFYSERLVFQLWLNPFLAVWPWKNYIVTSTRLPFSVC